MIELLLPLALSAQVTVPPATKPTLSQFGWQRVYSGRGLLPVLLHTYVEPRSIRAIDDSKTKFTVTAALEWEDRNDKSWRIEQTGYIIDCLEKSFQIEWISTKVSGQFVVNYVDDNETRRPPADSPMEAVIERVCNS